MDKIEKYEQLFPHYVDGQRTYRPGQKEGMKIVYDCLNKVDNKPHLVLHAPTGIGKTALVLPPTIQYVLDNTEKVVIYLTSRNEQHAAIIKTINDMKILNYTSNIIVSNLVSRKDLCLAHTKPTNQNLNDLCKKETTQGICTYYSKHLDFNKDGENDIIKITSNKILTADYIKQECKRVIPNICPYYMILSQLKKSNVIIADYNQLLDPKLRDVFLKNIGRNIEDVILILDEAHNLPTRTRTYMDFNITELDIDNAIIECDNMCFDNLHTFLVNFKQEIREILQTDSIFKDPRKTEKLLKQKELIQYISECGFDIKQLKQEFIKAGSIGSKTKLTYIGEFLWNWFGCFSTNEEDSIRSLSKYNLKDNKTKITRTIFKINYSGIDPMIITKSLFNQVHSVILMSGTLKPIEFYRDILGLNSDNTQTEVLKPVFKKENRPIYIQDNVTTESRFRKYPELWEQYTINIIEVINNSSCNIGVFFPSYDISKRLIEKLKGKINKKIFIEEQGVSKDNKVTLKRDFVACSETTEKAVLFCVMDANFSEGIDFRDKQMGAVIVVGFPLPPFSLMVQKLIKKYNRLYKNGIKYAYYIPTINRVIQAAGRHIRTPTDKGVTVLMDSRYNEDHHKLYLPDGLDTQVCNQLESKIKEFYGT